MTRIQSLISEFSIYSCGDMQYKCHCNLITTSPHWSKLPTLPEILKLATAQKATMRLRLRERPARHPHHQRTHTARAVRLAGPSERIASPWRIALASAVNAQPASATASFCCTIRHNIHVPCPPFTLLVALRWLEPGKRWWDLTTPVRTTSYSACLRHGNVTSHEP